MFLSVCEYFEEPLCGCDSVRPTTLRFQRLRSQAKGKGDEKNDCPSKQATQFCLQGVHKTLQDSPTHYPYCKAPQTP